MKNFFKTKTRWYFVKQNEDGSLWITCDGLTGIENAGQFVISLGGIDKVLERCTEEISIEEFIARRNESVEKRKNHRLMSLQMNAEKERKEELEAISAYEKIAHAPINPTLPNLKIVLRYILATDNRPSMTVGYSANIYDCDGKIAVGMKLDEPIVVAGEKITKIGYKIPRGHLTQYSNIDQLMVEEIKKI